MKSNEVPHDVPLTVGEMRNHLDEAGLKFLEAIQCGVLDVDARTVAFCKQLFGCQASARELLGPQEAQPNAGEES